MNCSCGESVYCKGWCKKCYRRHYYLNNCNHLKIKAHQHYHNHPEIRKRKKQKRSEQKLVVINHYGGRCICCGEGNIVFLTIDHINGGGTQHLRSLGSDSQFYPWLIRNNFPQDFQVLCMNCNWAKHLLGMCPHQQINEEV
jgi:hypothetical protein